MKRKRIYMIWNSLNTFSGDFSQKFQTWIWSVTISDNLLKMQYLLSSLRKVCTEHFSGVRVVTPSFDRWSDLVCSHWNFFLPTRFTENIKVSDCLGTRAMSMNASYLALTRVICTLQKGLNNGHYYVAQMVGVLWLVDYRSITYSLKHVNTNLRYIYICLISRASGPYRKLWTEFFPLVLWPTRFALGP